MKSQEAEKIKLMNIYEGMTDDEFVASQEADRLATHPERDKIKAIQALIAKERNTREKEMGEVAGPLNTDGTPKSNAEMTDDEREDFYNNLDSVDEGREDLNDLIEVIKNMAADEFDGDEVGAAEEAMEIIGQHYEINFEFGAGHGRMEERKAAKGLDEGSQSELNQELLNFGSQSEVDQYMDSLRQSGDGFDNIEDYIEDFKNYIADKGLDEGVKWMKRIAGVK